MTSGFDEISVISTMNIGARAGTPVLHFDRTNICRAHLAGRVPSQFVNRPIALHSQKIASAHGGYDCCPAILQLPQAWPVEMIHMRVREQDQIRNPNF